MNTTTWNTAIGALITGAAVVLGVVLAEWLKRSHERTNALRTATMELAIKVPHVVAGITDTGTPTDTAMDSQWSRDRELAMEMLIMISNTSMRLRRNGKAIKAQAKDLNARLAAAEFEYFLQGRLLTKNEAYDITNAGLFTAVFGASKTMDDEIKGYMHTTSDRSVPSVPLPPFWKRILTKCRKCIHV